jgi:uncharacterized SAM-binding protein YcdF (DUF218 family)
MDTTQLIPLLTTIVLPPMGPLLLAFFGLLLLASGRRLSAGLTLLLALGSLWFVSSHASAVLLARKALPQFEAVAPEALSSAGVQAIVVLGGGMEPYAPEYSDPQLNARSHERLRYGIWLARKTALPIAYSGGAGWTSATTTSEALTAQKSMPDYGSLTLKWTESTSRNTEQNAQNTAKILQKDGIKKIALVTHTWHMPRAQRYFAQAGFEVTAAPMGYVLPQEQAWLEWLPTGTGLYASRDVLREVLALRMMQ